MARKLSNQGAETPARMIKAQYGNECTIICLPGTKGEEGQSELFPALMSSVLSEFRLSANAEVRLTWIDPHEEEEGELLLRSNRNLQNALQVTSELRYLKIKVYCNQKRESKTPDKDVPCAAALGCASQPEFRPPVQPYDLWGNGGHGNAPSGHTSAGIPAGKTARLSPIGTAMSPPAASSFRSAAVAWPIPYRAQESRPGSGGLQPSRLFDLADDIKGRGLHQEPLLPPLPTSSLGTSPESEPLLTAPSSLDVPDRLRSLSLSPPVSPGSDTVWSPPLAHPNKAPLPCSRKGTWENGLPPAPTFRSLALNPGASEFNPVHRSHCGHSGSSDSSDSGHSSGCVSSEASGHSSPSFTAQSPIPDYTVEDFEWSCPPGRDDQKLFIYCGTIPVQKHLAKRVLEISCERNVQVTDWMTLGGTRQKNRAIMVRYENARAAGLVRHLLSQELPDLQPADRTDKRVTISFGHYNKKEREDGMRDLSSLWIHCPNEQEVMCETVRHHAAELDVNVQVRRVSSAVLANFDTPMIAQRMLLIMQDYEHHLGKQAHAMFARQRAPIRSRKNNRN